MEGKRHKLGKLFLLSGLFLMILLHMHESIFAQTGPDSNLQSVRVLLYHKISSGQDDPFNPYVISAPVFESQIFWLKDNGYKCITVSEMFRVFTEDTDENKFAVITFDDGYPEVYSLAFPVLRETGCPATIYLVAGKINEPKNLTSEMIREMYSEGWEIGSHSMTHSDLSMHEDLDSEICGSRDLIASLTEIPKDKIVSFAYPYGNSDEVIAQKVWKCGYRSGAGLGQISAFSGQNPYYFPRYPVIPDMDEHDFSSLFETGLTE